MGMWEIDGGPISEWLDAQDDRAVAYVWAALEVLAERGPALGRPLVDTVSHARHANMKELRPASPGQGEVRILFAFDPCRRAIMLLAGDKASGGEGHGRWSTWYRWAVPEADRRCDLHLKGLGDGP